jgi:hypothetical protein
MSPESVDVTAGLGGFLAFFVLALALYFLMRNMNARLRRMAYRQEQEARVVVGHSGPGLPKSPDSEGGNPDVSELGLPT